jgi:hypothetical protein
MIKTVQVTGEVVEKEAEGKEKEYDKWELEDAARTLQRAEEIKADKKLMTALAPYLEKNIKSLAGLRKLAVKRTAEGK